MKTICKECIFAKWTEHNGHQTQTGCSFNRLDKFKDLKMIESQNKTYYEISRLCNACRQGEYNNLKEAIEKVRKQIIPKIDFIILLDEKDTLKNISDIVDDIIHQTVHPNKVFFVKNHGIDNCKDIYNVIKLLGKCQIDFTLTTPVAECTFDEKIRLASRKSKGDYYSIFDCNYIPNYFVERIDKFINEDLKQFLVIKPKEGLNGTTFFRRVDQTINSTVEETVKYIEENCPHLVVKWL